jgi:hypothetical protein
MLPKLAIFPKKFVPNREYFCRLPDRRGTRKGFGLSDRLTVEDGIMGERRRIKHIATFEERSVQGTDRLREQARKLRREDEREGLLRKIRQTETAAQISRWISSPGLQPPKLR